MTAPSKSHAFCWTRVGRVCRGNACFGASGSATSFSLSVARSAGESGRYRSVSQSRPWNSSDDSSSQFTLQSSRYTNKLLRTWCGWGYACAAWLCCELKSGEQQAETREDQRTQANREALLQVAQIILRGDVLGDSGTHGIDNRVGVLGIEAGGL